LICGESIKSSLPAIEFVQIEHKDGETDVAAKKLRTSVESRKMHKPGLASQIINY
jgi:hypothetical protein